MGAIFNPLTDSVMPLPPLSMVSASAGTGKTWTVTHLATRWLLEADGREPGQLLIVTFARDAARELKSRLYGRLEDFQKEIERIAAGQRSDDELWKKHLASVLDRDGIDVVRERCVRSLRLIDEVSARTIHSFASIAQNGADSFVENSRELRFRSARQAMAELAHTNPEGLRDLLDAVKTQGSRPRRLAEQVAKTLELMLPMGGSQPGALGRFVNRVQGDETQQLFVQLVLRAEEFETQLRGLERATTFDSVIGDLLLEVRRDPNMVRRRIGEQFHFVIIDEFQDTDAGQWTIFEELFLKGPQPVPVLVVGDAKQAIYSFRGGDVTMMQKIQSEVLHRAEAGLSTLATNYRSHSNLVKQLNEFYAPDGEPHEFIPGDDGAQIVYEPVSSPDSLSTNHGLFSLRDMRNIKAKESEDYLIKDVLSEVQRLVGGEGCDPLELPYGRSGGWTYSDIVILSRSKSTLRRLQHEMDRLHIPYVTPRSLSVFSSLAADQVRALLWALADLDDQRRWRSLAATWFASLTTSSDALTVTRSLREGGIGDLQRVAMSGGFLKALLEVPGGQRHVTDVEHIFAAMAKEFPTGTSPYELLTWLEDAISNAEESDESVDGQRRIESDENAVRLMTIHASKGLQFPVVLLPNLETMGGDSLVVSENKAGEKHIDLASVFIGAKERKALEGNSVYRENDRLIYVGLTRGEQVVTAWIKPTHKQTQLPAWDNLITYWTERERGSGPRVIKLTQEAVDNVVLRRGARNAEHLANVDVLPIGRSTNEPTHRWSYSSLHHEGTVEESAEIDSRSGAEDDGSGDGDLKKSKRGFYAFGALRGTNLGDALHGVFEDAVGRVAASNDVALQRIIEVQFARQGLEPTTDLLATMQRLLRYPLGGQWGDTCLDNYFGAPVSVASEMRFTIPVSGEAAASGDMLREISQLVARHDPAGPFTNHFMKSADILVPQRLTQGFLTGSIDLVAPTLGAEGRYVVLDYKSNSLTLTPDFSPASLVVEMAASGYPLQALIYSVALHRHLTARLSGYEPERHLGGATYFYLRGASLVDAVPGEGVIHWAIPPALTVAVSALLRGVA